MKRVVFAIVLAGLVAEGALCAAYAVWVAYGPVPHGAVFHAVDAILPYPLVRWGCVRSRDRFPYCYEDHCYRVP